jgi:hypothetical protein
MCLCVGGGGSVLCVCGRGGTAFVVLGSKAGTHAAVEVFHQFMLWRLWTFVCVVAVLRLACTHGGWLIHLLVPLHSR